MLISTPHSLLSSLEITHIMTFSPFHSFFVGVCHNPLSITSIVKCIYGQRSITGKFTSGHTFKNDSPSPSSYVYAQSIYHGERCFQTLLIRELNSCSFTNIQLWVTISKLISELISSNLGKIYIPYRKHSKYAGVFASFYISFLFI